MLSALASCDQADPNLKPDPTQNLTQIARIEKEEGITLFKRDFPYSEGGTNAILTLATRNEELFERVIENMEVSFSLIYELPSQGDASSESTLNEVSAEPSKVEGEELIVEFTKMERAKGVIGIRTKYNVQEESITDGRQASHGYPFYVNHYSNHWPSTYTLNTHGFVARTGLHFYARWKWYQGYGSRTVCVQSSDCSSWGACAQDFDLTSGNCFWTFNVDGPYQMQAKIGYDEADDWTDAWTY